MIEECECGNTITEQDLYYTIDTTNPIIEYYIEYGDGCCPHCNKVHHHRTLAQALFSHACWCNDIDLVIVRGHKTKKYKLLRENIFLTDDLNEIFNYIDKESGDKEWLKKILIEEL